MAVSLIILSVIAGIAVTLSIFSFRNLLKLRTELKTAQREMTDLRNYVNLSIKELNKKTSVSCSDENKGFTTEMSVGDDEISVN